MLTLLSLISFGCVPIKWPSTTEKDEAEKDEAQETASDTSAVELQQHTGNDSALPPEDYSTLSISMQTEVGSIYAYELDGREEWVCAPCYSDGLLITYLDPGSWWLVASESPKPTPGERCNRSEVFAATAGGSFSWTLSELPGVLDDSRQCVLPGE